MKSNWLELMIFFHDALAVAALSGILLGTIGVFLHLRRNLFFGAALPQVAGFGFIVATACKIPQWLGALVILILFVGFLIWRKRRERIGLTTEAAIGLGFVASMAGSVLLSVLTGTETHGLELLLKGSVLTSTCEDLNILASFGLFILIVLYVARRRLTLISVDPDSARASGLYVWPFEAILYFGTSFIIVLTLEAAGAMACFGLLLLPGLGALAIARTVEGVFKWAAVIGLLSALSGIVIALAFDLPTGPAMIITSLAIVSRCIL